MRMWSGGVVTNGAGGVAPKNDVSEREARLGDHLARLNPQFGQGHWSRLVGRAILADPQGHIDALVVAGVLEREGSYSVFYRVVQPEPPHEHLWYVVYGHISEVELLCGCGEKRRVPNELPIEVPS